MRKTVFLFAITLLVISATQAQIKPDFDKSRVKKTAPTPAPVNKTTSMESTPALVYNLTAVRVKIRTGSDNKEFPSIVHAWVRARNTPSTQKAFSQMQLVNEMKINSETEFGLEKWPHTPPETKLDAFQSSGLKFYIWYLPNFFADAWKIESITLVLEFKDQFGNPHPTLGSKTIAFTNAYGFLNNEYRNMECETDGTFAPLTAVIKK